MSKTTTPPLRIGTAVLAEDLSTTPNRPRQREILTWVQRPEPEPPSDDETVDTDNR